MKTIFANLVVLLLPVLCCPSLAAAADSASGSVSLEGITFEVVDVLAYPNRDGLAIALSDTAFDKEKMRKDGKVDTFDRMRHGGQVVTINLSKGAPTQCVDYSFQKGDSRTSGSVCESGVADAVELSENSDERVAGKMNWKKDSGERIDVSFDAPVEAGGS